jgi:DNA-binding response OmpR family regulator
MHRLLVVDDDPKLAGLLQEYLSARGFLVERAATGPLGLERHGQGDIDLVILDIMLPGMDGLEVLRQLRTRGRTPVVMLTARGDDVDRIVGLELGADDYLAKPFNPRELLARITAVLRRGAPATAAPAALEAVGLRLDPELRTVTADGVPVTLTTTEFEVLRTLMQAAGRIVPRERLMELARGADFASFERSVDVHISHLRRKLDDDPKDPRRIKTIRGVGYLIPRS